MDAATSVDAILRPWSGPLGAPPFAAARAELFAPAFEAAFAERRREIAAIAESAEPASFDNTIVALEKLGRALDRVAALFFHLVHVNGDDPLEAIERDVAPKLAREQIALYLNPGIFARVEALWSRRQSLALDSEQARLLKRWRDGFLRNGAALDESGKARFAAIEERLAELGTAFRQNVLADERAFTLPLETVSDRAGLSDAFLASATENAAARGVAAPVATLSRSSYEPFLQYSTRRDLREKLFKAFVQRGANGGESDNRAIMGETLALRAERASLLGFESYADYKLDDQMAKRPDAAEKLLADVWDPARRRALEEAEALQAIIAAEGGNFELKPWDWRFYAEKRRKALYDFDEDAVKPYFSLASMIEAAFYVAGRLFGLNFEPRPDIDLYHEDARAWRVADERGETLGLFIGDYFARPSKRSGAWMNALREASAIDGKVTPVVVNVSNFARAAEWRDCLLSLDEARTLFHEFGHALHGLLSQARYPTLAGTSVARDFVEFPSQLYEHWLETPEVLRRFARHRDTAEPMSEEMIGRVVAARRFNQGFLTVEYCASAFVDLALHRQSDPKPDADVVALEDAELEAHAMPETIAARHRTPHFQHIFSSDGYSAGYYSYLWSEVLDADGFEAFVEAGDVFDAEVARRLKDFVYSGGDTRDPAEAYRLFRGRDPRPEALLVKRGLT